ncbi:MAG: tetratricopeptide repeat protein [Myxococcales bacterium]|jgi:tetratricopeptide (TPR) repeat protein
MRVIRTGSILAALGLLCLSGSAVAAEALQDAGQNNKAVQAYNDGDYGTAVLLFADLADNAVSEEIRLRSEYYLAQSFFKMGLYDAALRQYSFVVKAGPNHPHYLRAIEGIVQVSEALREDFITGTVLDKEYNDEFAKLPIETLNKINYIVGMVSYRKNKRDEAMSFFASVPPDSSYFARARYMQGILFARNGDFEKALESFGDVIKLSNTLKLTYFDLESIRHLAILGTARTYYGMGRYADAVKHYEQIPRFSEYWDEALFENGWARFHNDDIGGALGSLQALHAPQFAGSFQPESWILKATVYYSSCLYDDAKLALEGFEKIYLPISERLAALLEGDKDNDFYHALLDEKSTELPRSVKNYLVANKRLVQFKAYADQLDREKAIIRAEPAWKGSRIQGNLLGEIEQSKDLAVQLTGSFVKRRLDDAAKTIIGFDGQKEIIKFEVAKGETDMLERRLNQRTHLAEQALYRPVMPGANWEYWQFQGEFWLDEIGYYQYTLKSGCMKREE